MNNFNTDAFLYIFRLKFIFGYGIIIIFNLLHIYTIIINTAKIK